MTEIYSCIIMQDIKARWNVIMVYLQSVNNVLVAHGFCNYFNYVMPLTNWSEVDINMLICTDFDDWWMCKMTIKCPMKVVKEIILTCIAKKDVAGKSILPSVLRLLVRGFGYHSTLRATRDADLCLVSYCINLKYFGLLSWCTLASFNEMSWR